MPFKDPEVKRAYLKQWRSEHYRHVLETNRKNHRKKADEINAKRRVKRTVTNESYRSYIDKNKQHLYEQHKDYYYKARTKAIKLLGGSCDVCRDTEMLEFHHLYYGLDSRTNFAFTFYEVLKHPERFQLLCRTCHQIITRIDKDPRGIQKAQLILERLINSVQELRG